LCAVAMIALSRMGWKLYPANARKVMRSIGHVASRNEICEEKMYQGLQWVIMSGFGFVPLNLG
jgi:hypothetical protein